MKLSTISDKTQEGGLVVGVLLVLCALLATPAWGGEIVAPLSLLWQVDPGRPLAGSRDDAEAARDLFTLEEAVGLALEANHLVKNQERLRSITVSVKHAYDGMLRVQRAFELHQEEVRLYRELDRMATEARLGSERAAQLLRVRVSLATAEHRVLDTQQELASWTGQLNFLMGRDRQARLRAAPSQSDAASAVRAPSQGPLGYELHAGTSNP